MFTSIRGRLWLSYAALILISISIFSVVVGAFLIRNPYIYRQTTARVLAAHNLLLKSARTASQLDLITSAMDVRVLMYASDGALISDSRSTEARIPVRLAESRAGRAVQTARDSAGRTWLYTRAQLPDASWLLVAAPRPRVLPTLDVLGDELWRPMLQGAGLALLVALAMAYLLARWIGAPLQELVEAARSVAPGGGAPRSLVHGASANPSRPSETGPEEVRELTRAFNGMLDRVAASDRSQREFVSSVSHELKTPLTAIQGFAQAIRDGTAATNDEKLEAAEIIHAEAGRLHRLAVDLLDLARLDAGTMQLRRVPVDMMKVMQNAIARLGPLAEGAGITLDITAGPAPPMIHGDVDRLTQILTNLVDNAVKFTPHGGRVVLGTESDSSEVRVTVTDTGQGIGSADLPHIFERFYQADSSRAGGEQHGTGLGLTIAQELAAAHGGRISVRSALGQGAEFVVHLPLSDDGRQQRGAA